MVSLKCRFFLYLAHVYDYQYFRTISMWICTILGIKETCDCDYYDTSDYNDVIDDWNGRTSIGRKSK